MTYQINELKLIRARSKLFCADARNFGLTNMMARSALKIRNRARAQNINTPSQNEVYKQNFEDNIHQFDNLFPARAPSELKNKHIDLACWDEVARF
mmetsp:Transcript_58480/g.69801  ORF Transcript_58480/g.69801 Transcript_58480/m.69801 type:complete len:96 (-) Transcript_58480:680-967(-)